MYLFYVFKIKNVKFVFAVVEALAIIRAKRVLRLLGLRWTDVRISFLPHIAQLSVNVHPMLKVLYRICERLDFAQAEKLVRELNEQHLSVQDQNLPFYDYSYLEVFLLNFINHGLILLGNASLEGVNVTKLTEYFENNKMEAMSSLLKDTIRYNSYVAHNCAKSNNGPNLTSTSSIQPSAERITASTHNAASLSLTPLHISDDSGACMSSGMFTSDEQQKFGELINQKNKIAAKHSIKSNENDFESYVIRRQHAGYILIINQSEFYTEQNPELQVSEVMLLHTRL